MNENMIEVYYVEENEQIAKSVTEYLNYLAVSSSVWQLPGL